MIDLRLGDWKTALADVERVDAIICDPPYGARTHAGHDRARRRSPKHDRGGSTINNKAVRRLSYPAWSPDDVSFFVDAWATRCAGWFCALTSHDLVPAYAAAFERAGRYVFAPLPCVQNNMTCRFVGDGPSSWTTWLVVSRPRSEPFRKWGTLRGAYVGPSYDAGENSFDKSKRAVIGAKPLWLMQAIVRDYSRPGDIVCDPTAGGGTTLIAAAIEGRRSVGAEVDPKTHRLALERIARGYTPNMFSAAYLAGAEGESKT